MPQPQPDTSVQPKGATKQGGVPTNSRGQETGNL